MGTCQSRLRSSPAACATRPGRHHATRHRPACLHRCCCRKCPCTCLSLALHPQHMSHICCSSPPSCWHLIPYLAAAPPCSAALTRPRRPSPPPNPRAGPGGSRRPQVPQRAAGAGAQRPAAHDRKGEGVGGWGKGVARPGRGRRGRAVGTTTRAALAKDCTSAHPGSCIMPLRPCPPAPAPFHHTPTPIPAHARMHACVRALESYPPAAALLASGRITACLMSHAPPDSSQHMCLTCLLVPTTPYRHTPYLTCLLPPAP